MITLTKSGNAIVFTFDDNDHYLNDGTIEVPVNSLTLVTDDSQMATFRKSASNDIFISATYDELGMSKADLETFYKENMVGSTGGGSGSGITSGEVQTMIDESISGKADTSDVQEIASDVTTVSGDVNTLSGDVSTLSGDVANKADTSAVTASINAAVSGKMDTSAFNTYSASTDARLAEDEETTAAALNELNDALDDKADTTAVTASIAALDEKKLDASAYTPTDLSNYYTKSETSGATQISTALTSKADTATTYTKSQVDTAIATKQDTLVSGTNIKTINNQSLLGSGNINIQGGGSNVIELTQAEYDELTDIDPDVFYIITDADGGATTGQVQTMIDNSISGKQDTLVSGTNIKTINNQSLIGSGNIDIQGGGGKAIVAGTNISVTTGATADTINCTLPISVTSDNANSVKIGNGNCNAYDNNCIVAGNSVNSNFANCICVGSSLTAGANNSQVFGDRNGSSNEDEHVTGRLNISNKANTTFGDSGNTLFSVGNGYVKYPIDGHHNAFEIRQNGDIYIADTNDTTYQNYYEKPMIKLQDALGGGGVPESAFTAYTASTDARLDEDEEVTAAALNSLNDALSDKADTSAFTAHTADTTIHTTSAEKTSWNGAVTALGGLKLVSLTQAQYDNLATKDASTLYIITGSN